MINFEIKCGLIDNLWRPANPLFLRDQCVTHTGKPSSVGCVREAEAHTHKLPFDSVARTEQQVLVAQ